MNERYVTGIVAILLGIIGVAALAVLVSGSSSTTGVIGAGTNGFKNALCAALSPIGVRCGELTPDVSSTITFGS